MTLFSPTDDKPTLPELISFQGKTECMNIAQKIGTNWLMVGTALLDDKEGTIMPGIKTSCLNDVDEINMRVLSRWIQGQGIADCTWRGLLGVLELHCKALAESVRKGLTVDPGKDPKPAGKPMMQCTCKYTIL